MSINNKAKRAMKKKTKEAKKMKLINNHSKSKNPSKIEFICPVCKTREFIPRNVVEFLDDLDSNGVDTSVPPRFDCKNCMGKMEPIYYIGVTGHIYRYDD